MCGCGLFCGSVRSSARVVFRCREGPERLDSFFKIFFLFLFFSCTGKDREEIKLETGKKEGWESWIPACSDCDEDFELEAQSIQCQLTAQCKLYINAIFKVWFKGLLRVKPALCCSTDKTGFEFSLAKCQRVISERGYCRCSGPWSECEVERPGQHLRLLPSFSTDALANRALRGKRRPCAHQPSRGEVKRCGYRFFWCSHRGLKGL